MRFGAAAALAVIACSTPSVGNFSIEVPRDERGPRSVPMPGRGERVSLQQLVKIREKNARKRRR